MTFQLVHANEQASTALAAALDAKNRQCYLTQEDGHMSHLRCIRHFEAAAAELADITVCCTMLLLTCAQMAFSNGIAELSCHSYKDTETHITSGMLTILPGVSS